MAQTLEDKNNNCKELRQTADSLSSQQERLALEKDKVRLFLRKERDTTKTRNLVRNNTTSVAVKIFMTKTSKQEGF